MLSGQAQRGSEGSSQDKNKGNTSSQLLGRHFLQLRELFCLSEYNLLFIDKDNQVRMTLQLLEQLRK